MDRASPQSKLDALTGLRFLAAALIVFHHSRALRIPVPHYAYDHGVSLFFVLSGFILAYVYPKLDDWKSIRSFIALRVARIWPVHAVALVFAAFLLLPVGNPTYLTFLTNLLMLHAWVPSAPWYFSYNPASWSISTELFFYLAFPLLIWQFHKTYWWKWLASAGLVIILFALGRKLDLPAFTLADKITLHGIFYVNPLARLIEFVTGMVAYLGFVWLYARVEKLKSISPTGTAIGATVIEVLLFMLVIYFLMYRPLYVMIVENFGATVEKRWLAHTDSFPLFPLLIIALAIGAGKVSKLLSTKLAVLLGEISYSIYLVHQVVFGTYVVNFRPTGTAPDYLGLGLCLAVVLGLSYLCWRIVEVPCRTWAKNRLRERRVARPALASSQAPAE